MRNTTQERQRRTLVSLLSRQTESALSGTAADMCAALLPLSRLTVHLKKRRLL